MTLRALFKKACKNKSSRDNKVKGAAACKIESKPSRTSAVNSKGSVKSEGYVILDDSESDFDYVNTAEKTAIECPLGLL
jgi:hypothetical protein